MRRKHLLATLTAVTAAVALVVGGSRIPVASADSSQLFLYRVPVVNEAAAQRLISHGFDVLENRDGGDLFVIGDTATAVQLRVAGFRPASTEKLAPTGWKAPSTRLVP